MPKQDPNAGRNWYVVHTYAGYEDAVAAALKQRVDSFGMQDYVFDVRVPKEKQLTFKKNQPVEEEKKLFPGYVLVDMTVTDDSWYLVRNTPNVTGFVGSGNIPVPVTPEEFGIIERRIGEQQTKFKSDFQVGDLVIIVDGPFKNYEGSVDSVDVNKGKLTVMVLIFDRETPVELDFTQVRKK
ncbi:transcription termination/antitermination protein NusG [Candidatus Peribacteria bacterium RIFCSPHIGHO2_02_FULL_53_20]|nr:MAG: transcription termination/antitermination protein NusG [Candidatus Peribacteria bacterium RIFCSPHIGHO2_02_FULL_53_20]OGJ67015.1 MAG: transcription termination/antitermination protein NusG [Candidatus Peribacteria bacterium RIFCSPLOWO2_01_FULL_53_10]OGJ72876.1 MAG: transcription termination/antitermination protein NusG [Candidatus Peribacteria bacterium RIFCSPLOWO2_12_FULL_53_10]